MCTVFWDHLQISDQVPNMQLLIIALNAFNFEQENLSSHQNSGMLLHSMKRGQSPYVQVPSVAFHYKY